MNAYLRCLRDQRTLWRAWLALLPLTIVVPVLGLVMPLIERDLIDTVVLGRHPELLLGTVALYAAVWVASGAMTIGGGALLTYLSERIALDYRRQLLAHASRLSLGALQRSHSGRTMSLFTNDVPAVTSLAGRTITQALGSVVTVVVATILMFALSWQLALAGALAPPLIAAAARVLTRPLRPAARNIQEKLAELTERVQENLAGTREISAFVREREQDAQFTRTLGELLRLRMRLTFMESGIQAGQLAFSLAVTVVILGYGAYLVIHDQTTLGTVIAMRSLFSLVFGPAGRLIGIFGDVQKGLAALDRIYAFLDEAPRVREAASAAAPTAVRGAIEFQNVSFGYERGRDVLHDISLDVQPGERVALVGPSGAGKSTLTNLVARFYDPTAGAILLDGVDLRQLTLAGLRDHIGMVFQSTFLFSTTIGANIAFGRQGATRDQIVAAARAANAWEFIAELPKGLDSEVGERGLLLSEGQKQRIAIARALLRDPRVLILDEPTSALDARSEHLLQTALANLMRERTTFVIAHRLDTVVTADRILVLDGGRIVQHGRHADLLAADGLYRDLFRLQFPATDARPPGLVVANAPAGAA